MQEPYAYDETPRGFWTRMRDRLWGSDIPEDEDENPPSVAARKGSTIRLETARGLHVAVRLSAVGFNDARIAADGLKGGQQQIVNLEKAEPEMAERILDFLSGVAYAMDGSVERITDNVYLFAPANVHVDIDGGPQVR